MSYTQLVYHIVFRTKNSVKTINAANERLLYNYIYITSKNMGCTIYRIGGMEDHLHILVSIPATLTVADYVKNIKVSSSKRFDKSMELPYFEGWASGYAALSYTYRDKDMITRYIMNQKEHHKHRTFAEEYRMLLEEAGIAIDERYFLKE